MSKRETVPWTPGVKKTDENWRCVFKLQHFLDDYICLEFLYNVVKLVYG